MGIQSGSNWRTWLLIGAAMGVFGVAAGAGDSIMLTEDGRPVATIVLAQQPTRAAQFAAYELQSHVRQITDAELPIVRDAAAVQGTRLLVGPSEATEALGLPGKEFGLQEYLIRFLPRTIVLMGKDRDDRGEVQYDYTADPNAFQTWPDFWEEQGTLYAVYDFLERFCQVRWFDHTEVGADIPQTRTLVVKGKDLRRSPAMRYRYIGRYSGEYPHHVSLWRHDTEGFKKWEALAYANAHAGQTYGADRFATVQLFRLRRREGGEKSIGSHSLEGYYDRFWKKNPQNPDAFVAEHPDWFAQGYPEGTQPPNLCYTHPGLIQQVAQDARDYFAGESKKIGLPRFHWGENFFAVEPMDNSLFCRCARCQEIIRRGHPEADNPNYSRGTHSDYFFNFVNEVARLVRKSNPDKWVITLAYMTHAWPPQTLKLEPNVAVQFCFASNRAPHSRQGYENDLRALRAWAKEAGRKRPLYLWLYYCFPVEFANNGGYHCFPGFFAHTIGEQFRLFHQMGIRGITHCGYGQEVEAYVTYKLMDDPTLDVDVLLDEYFSRLYGPAGDPLKRLYLAIEKTYCRPENYPKDSGHSEPEIAWNYLGTARRMAEFGKLMEQAKALAQTDLHKRRVELFERGTWEYMVQGRKQYVDRMSAPIPAVRVPRAPEAGGDPHKVEWSKASALGGPWYEAGTAKPAPRNFAGRVAHDGRFLYLELIDPCETAKLHVSPTVSCYDDWEVFVAGQRSSSYRQYLIGPTGLVVALSHGEVAGRMNVEIPDHGVEAVGDTSAADQWVARMSVPLDQVLPGGVKPGGKFYMNLIRVNGPEISVTAAGYIGIYSWVSYSTVHETDRLAEITLE